MVIAVSLVAVVAAAVVLATSGGSYDHVGRGGLSIGEESPPPGPPPVRVLTARPRSVSCSTPATRGVPRAGSRRSTSTRSSPALDAPAADPELEAEVRAFVEARNERRVARGKAPLDVEAEIARRLRGKLR